MDAQTKIPTGMSMMMYTGMGSSMHASWSSLRLIYLAPHLRVVGPFGGGQGSDDGCFLLFVDGHLVEDAV